MGRSILCLEGLCGETCAKMGVVILGLPPSMDSSRPPLAVGQHWMTSGGWEAIVVSEHRITIVGEVSTLRCYVYDPNNMYRSSERGRYIYYEKNGRSNIHGASPELEVMSLLSEDFLRSEHPLNIIDHHIMNLTEESKSNYWTEPFDTLDMGKVLSHIHSLRFLFPRMYPGSDFSKVSYSVICKFDFDRSMCSLRYRFKDGSCSDVGYFEPSTPMWKIEEMASSINMFRMVDNKVFTEG